MRSKSGGVGSEVSEPFVVLDAYATRSWVERAGGGNRRLCFAVDRAAAIGGRETMMVARVLMPRAAFAKAAKRMRRARRRK